ncbi:MAG: DUF1249 domain-containing protein [Xanthomonadales bacterium]|nr:DUF1249 domain-containing protein [Xanthomonadales bacterium]
MGQSRLGLLLALNAENYRRLTVWLPSARSALQPLWASEVADGSRLYLEQLEQQRHTEVLRLTQLFVRSDATEVEPCAYLRLYHDAQLAEVTHFRLGEGLKLRFGPPRAISPQARQRYRLAHFLSRWIDYLGASTATDWSMAEWPPDIDWRLTGSHTAPDPALTPA